MWVALVFMLAPHAEQAQTRPIELARLNKVDQAYIAMLDKEYWRYIEMLMLLGLKGEELASAAAAMPEIIQLQEAAKWAKRQLSANWRGMTRRGR
jgi:hypothetical protein